MCSNFTRVTSGIPQGSILGPFLYCVATSSLEMNSRNCHMVKYADDTTLCFPVYKDDANDHILLHHQQLLDWSDSMSLKINRGKCKTLTIFKHSGTQRIDIPGTQTVDTLCILGVHFNSSGTWSTHINNVIRNASRKFYILRTLRPLLSDEHLITVYNGILRSLLEYCSSLFVGLHVKEGNVSSVFKADFIEFYVVLDALAKDFRH